jgi:hypothetical protein
MKQKRLQLFVLTVENSGGLHGKVPGNKKTGIL